MAIQVKTDGRILLRLPHGVPVSVAMEFVSRHETWIARQYIRLQSRMENQREYGEDEKKDHIKMFRPVLIRRVAFFAARMGVTYGRISIRDQKTRWGSCSAAGNLNFNWRLALLSEALLDYVIVHELAHRLEMNHSSRFWAQVEKILPDYAERRKRLREFAL